MMNPLTIFKMPMMDSGRSEATRCQFLQSAPLAHWQQDSCWELVEGQDHEKLLAKKQLKHLVVLVTSAGGV